MEHPHRSPAGARSLVRPSVPALEPGAADVRNRLLRSGASRELVDELVAGVLASGSQGAYAIDAAAGLIGALFRVERPSRRGGRPYLLAFGGPTGGGKTTTMAKLGRRLIAAGRRVAFASFDALGASALGTGAGLSADVDRTELPIVAARTAKDVLRLARSHAEDDLLLLDTPGVSPRDGERLEALGLELERLRHELHGSLYLVLPASASQASLAIAARAFGRLSPGAAVLTKLDETSQPAGALEATLHADLPIAFLCDGQDVRAHLVRPKPGHFADLLLRGRLG